MRWVLVPVADEWCVSMVCVVCCSACVWRLPLAERIMPRRRYAALFRPLSIANLRRFRLPPVSVSDQPVIKFRHRVNSSIKSNIPQNEGILGWCPRFEGCTNNMRLAMRDPRHTPTRPRIREYFKSLTSPLIDHIPQHSLL